MKETLFDIFPQIKQQPLPTNDQTRDITSRLQQGDKHAEDELKQSYMRFVASVARQYLDMGLTKDKLLAAGTKGLITAGKKYNPNDKFRFIAYAVWWIRQSILNEITNHDANNIINKLLKT